MTWEDGEAVARGASATVYRTRDDIAVKVFEPFVPLIAAQIEAAGAEAACAAGLPVPRFLGLEEGPPLAIRMTYVAAPPLIEAMARHGADFVGRELARCQDLVRNADVPHGTGVLRVATLYGYQIDKGPLPEPLKRELQIELDRLPVGDAFCHLDLHPLNILWDGRRSTIIDWMNARLGPAGADVARTRIVLDALECYLGDGEQEREAAQQLRDAYEEATRAVAAFAWDESAEWMRVCKAARIQESLAPAEHAKLMQEFGLAI